VGDDFCTGVLGRVNAQAVAAVAARTAADMNFIFVVVCIIFCSVCYCKSLSGSDNQLRFPPKMCLNQKQPLYNDNLY
jgi:hypothetical protein